MCRYLPTDYRDMGSHDRFCMSLGQLASTVDVIFSKTSNAGIIGDFNANAYGSPFFLELKEFCEDNGLIMSDVDLLGSLNGTYTFVSASHGTSSWLDHRICSPNLHSLIRSISVEYAICVTNHMPLIVDFMFCSATLLAQEPVISNQPMPCWESVTQRQVILFNDSVRRALGPLLLSDINILQTTCISNCDDNSHIDSLAHCYKELTEAVTDSGVRCFRHRGINLRHPGVIPGWNESVRVRHSVARRAFLQWRASGSPREGSLYQQMRQARLSFKYALRKFKRDYEIVKTNKLAVFLQNREDAHFWTMVKQQLGGSASLPISFGDITGNINIANMWADHLKVIFNDDSCMSNNEILSQITRDPSPDVPPITFEDVFSAVTKLKCGKSAGWDRMSAEHLLSLQPDALSVIAVLLNCALNHGNLPEGLIFSVLVPLIKDKSGRLDDRSNYRAIALSTTMSKVLELILTERLQPFLRGVYEKF